MTPGFQTFRAASSRPNTSATFRGKPGALACLVSFGLFVANQFDVVFIERGFHIGQNG